MTIDYQRKIEEKYKIGYRPHVRDNTELSTEALKQEAYANGYKYLFSIVIPVYNTKKYVTEAIESIINQSIGFDTIQIVIVNDGSTDGSGEICSEYADRYPDNITYLSQTNGGASSARNLGLSKVCGKWVNFFDSDDIWSCDAFETVVNFIKSHRDIDIISLRHWFFDARKGPHHLNYKYKFDRIINIEKEAGCPQISFSNLFVEKSLLKSLEFNTNLEISEDFAEINEIIMRVGHYAVCTHGRYFYRKRFEEDSAIDSSMTKLSFYEQTPSSCYLKLFESSKKRFGTVIPYIQYCVMYDLQWRLKRPLPDSLSTEVKTNYRRTLRRILSMIDDEVIVSINGITADICLNAFALKYDKSYKEVLSETVWIGTRWCWRNGDRLIDMKQPGKLAKTLYIESINIGKNVIIIEGYCNYLDERAEELLKIDYFEDEKSWHAENFTRDDVEKDGPFDDLATRKVGYKVNIPWNHKEKVKLRSRIWAVGVPIDTRFDFDEAASFAKTLPHSYLLLEDAIITMSTERDQSIITIEPYSFMRVISLKAHTHNR